MSSEILNVKGDENIDSADEHTTEQEQQAPRKRMGRPRGSKNRTRFGQTFRQPREEGWGPGVKSLGRTKSLAAHRKWQRAFVMPQFVLSRKQAQDLLVKYLRSKPGKAALTEIVSEGFLGLSKLPDHKLGEFLVSTNLLSRYPHEIVIRGA